MIICYSYASRQRPERFFEGLDNIVAMSASPDYFIVVKLDDDDTTMNNDEVKARIATQYPMVQIKWGSSTSKIHAINRDLPADGWEIMICMSDDMRFLTYGFDDFIRAAMPDNLDGFIHCFDDYAKHKVCTVSILGRTYYERDGVIYQPCYYSMWSDNEATEVSIIRGCYIQVREVKIEHLHYTNNAKAKKDPLYWRNDTYNQDKAIYLERQAKNFGI